MTLYVLYRLHGPKKCSYATYVILVFNECGHSPRLPWDSSVRGVPLVKSSRETFDAADVFPIVFEPGVPAEGSVAENPQGVGLKVFKEVFLWIHH